MPGLLGVVSGQQDARTKLSLMLRPMERGGKRVSETSADAANRWAAGRVHLGVLQPEPQLAGSGPIHVLFHGDLYNRTELAASLDKTAYKPAASSVAGVVEALYRAKGAALGGDLKGSFCAAIIDESQKRILLVTDRVGSYPLYWFYDSGLFAFASEVRALVRIHPKPSLNPRAVNDLIKLSFPFGDKTLAAGVSLLPSSSVLTFDWERGAVSIEQYDSWTGSFKTSGAGKTEYFERLGRAFDVSMDRSVDGPRIYGLSLSGGLDTRVLLAALDRKKVSLSTFTLGGRGCADEVIGYQLARMANSKHEFVPLEESYLDDLLPMTRRMVSLTDGLYTSHGFTEVLALQGFEKSDISVLLRGHAGELAKASTAWPLHTDAHIFAMSSRKEFAPYLLARLESLNHGHSASGVFTDAWREASDDAAALQSIEHGLKGADLAPADLCSYLYLHEYHRRVTIPSLEIFREVAEVRLPLADPDFIEAVFQGPTDWRNGIQIHQSLIRRNSPGYLRVRNPNTGAPAGAGPLQEFVLDKVNTILRRLNVYGYRHYHAFDGWMRNAFLGVVDKVLLSPASLDRGILKQDAVRRLVDEAKQGATGHDHALQVLMLVELWQQENLQA